MKDYTTEQIKDGPREGTAIFENGRLIAFMDWNKQSIEWRCEYDDFYWIRHYAGIAMKAQLELINSMITMSSESKDKASIMNMYKMLYKVSIEHAVALLTAVKESEDAEKKK